MVTVFCQILYPQKGKPLPFPLKKGLQNKFSSFQVPAILKMFYDEDILDEKVLLEWAKKVSKKYVSKELSEQIHKKAEPFITWLKDAEEESEEDSDEDVELEFDERAKISTIKEKVNLS